MVAAARLRLEGVGRITELVDVAEERQAGGLPVPPAHTCRAVVGGERVELLDRRGREPAEQLAEREDRAPVDLVVLVRVREHGRDGRADVGPVHLREVVLRAVRAEEDRIGEAEVVVDVREAGEPHGEAVADQLAQPRHVHRGGGVPALVRAFSVDYQAIGAVFDCVSGEVGFDHGAQPVNELPCADLQPCFVQLGDERLRELAPLCGAVAALDQQRADLVLLGLGDDRRDVARSVSCISQIHIPRPANGLFLGTAIMAGPPTVAAGVVVVVVVPPRPDPPEPPGPLAEATPVSGPTVANASPSVADASAAANALA